MTTLIEKGTKGRFIELEENDVAKRFLIPDMPNLEGKLRGFLVKYPHVILVRTGRAIVASKDEANKVLDGFVDVPSKVLSMFSVDLCGDHPVLPQGDARYSEELIAEINSIVPYVEPEPEVINGVLAIPSFNTVGNVPPIELPKRDLTSTLKAQLAQQVLNKTSEEKHLSLVHKSEIEVVRNVGVGPAISLPMNVPISQQTNATKPNVIIMPSSAEAELISPEIPKMSETQSQLNDAIVKARQARELSKREDEIKSQIRVMEPRPQGKIDILLEKVNNIEILLTDGLTGEVTGSELEEWFYEHVDSIGHEKTFSILASRLKK